MTSKQFCLKWNNFQNNILNAFESLQNTEDLTDVTLTCEGINVKAHKFILSACSPYFRTVFKVLIDCNTFIWCNLKVAFFCRKIHVPIQ